MAAISRKLRVVTSHGATQFGLRNFLASEKGRTMAKAHGFRRAFIATPQRVNEALADYPINLHPIGRSGLFKPAGSVEITPNGLLVKHNGKRNEELTRLGTAIGRELRIVANHEVV